MELETKSGTRKVIFFYRPHNKKRLTDGEKFREIEDIIVVYISKFDIFNANRVIYHVDSVVRETGYAIDDGLIRVFANAQIKNGTIASEYLDCFLKKEVNNFSFPELTKRMNYLKH